MFYHTVLRLFKKPLSIKTWLKTYNMCIVLKIAKLLKKTYNQIFTSMTFFLFTVVLKEELSIVCVVVFLIVVLYHGNLLLYTYIYSPLPLF